MQDKIIIVGIAFLFIHWVADFLFQSDWIALNKSKRAEVLLLHVALYTFVLAWASLLILGLTAHVQCGWQALFAFWAVNGVSHFVIDALTSRLNTLLYGKNMRHWFFVSIGFDQFLHTSILLASLRLVL